MPTFYENKQLVTPGDLLAEGNYVAGENAYEEGGKIYSTQLGLVDYEERRVHVVALRTFYIPYIGDTIIGKVVDVGFSGWMLDINASYLAMLRASDVLDRPFKPQKNDLSSIFNIGDLIIAKVVAYNRTRDPLLTVSEPSLGKITRGQIVEVTPTKIPRLIGRQGSMISMLKRETGCHITLGQNGLVLVSGKTLEDEQLAISAIRKIDQEAHTSGLTDRVTKMIQKKKGGVKHAQKDD
ncbi:MAG: RNA-binding protein [Candidatus Bathyarchaeota archaeon]|nr:MAG: RNA-binding protein [Candidatus Bathyarchaeota archaeon]